jgi:tetratricopeptide (TPR) repeat protein
MAAVLLATIVILKLQHDSKGANQDNGISGSTQAMMSEIENLQRALSADPADPATLLKLANRLQDAKILSRAITIYQEYLNLKPADVNARVDLGVSYYEYSVIDTLHRDEDLESAAGQFRQALKQKPDHQLAQYNLGIVSLQRGDLHAAHDWFTRALQTDPNSVTGKKAKLLIQQHTFNNPS